MTRECVTHHHACDCREARFKALADAVREVAAGMDRYLGSVPAWRVEIDKLDAALQELEE